MKPEELLYAQTHEWVAIRKADGAKVATVGISDFAVQQLTDLVFMELPEIGQQVEAGHSIGEIESVKAVSDLYSPVTGEIVEVNAALPDNLETLSSDPYGDGWVARIKITDETAISNLMDHATYAKQCAAEG